MKAAADFNVEMGKRIRELREGKGYTRRELANLLGVELEMLKDFEKGRMRIFVEQLSKIAILFEVTTDYLIYGK